MIPSLSAAIADSVTRRRGSWLAVATVVLGAAAWACSHVGFRLDLADFMPPEPGGRGRLAPELLSGLSGNGRIAVVLESDDSIPVAQVRRLFDFLSPRLAAVPGVRAVNTRLGRAELEFTERHLPERIALYAEPGVLRVAADRLSREGIEAVMLRGEQPGAQGLTVRRARSQADPLGVIGLAAQGVRAWQGYSRVRLVDGYYALPGSRAFFLTIETTASLDDINAARALVLSVNEVLSAAREDPGLRPFLDGRQLYALGRAVSYTAAVDLLTQDGVRVTVAAAGVALVLLGIFFGGIGAPLAISATVGSGLVLTGAVAWLVFRSVSVVTWVFVGLLVGLGVDFGIHVAVHHWAYGTPERERAGALTSALSRPGGGIVLGAATSALAFLALIAVPYRWMTELAVLTACGLLLILACTWTVLPLLLTFSRPQVRADPLWSRWTTRLALTASGRRRWWVAAPWGALVVASALAVPGLQFEPHPWAVALRGNPESARLDRLSREAGTSFTPLLVVSEGTSAVEAITRDREAVGRLRPVSLRAGVATIQSLARWLPAPEQQRANIDFIHERRGLFTPERFARDFEAVVAQLEEPDPYLTEVYLPEVMRSLNPDLAELTVDELRGLGLGPDIDRHLVVRDGTYFAVSYIFLREFPWAEGVASRFLSVAHEVGVEDLPGVTLTGDPLRSADHARVIRRSVLVSTILATLLVGALLALRFRRLSIVGLCLAPLVCGLGSSLLVMRLAGIDLTLLTIAIAPILVGIGVDDGIHILDRLCKGHDVDTVLLETGGAMTLTTLTTAGAFAALSLTTFTGIRELGLIGGVGLVTCLLASVHLIPLGWSLLRTLHPPRRA